MDPAHDALIAIGAVAMRGGQVVPGDSFEVILRQDTASTRANIVVHGVGVGAQKGGADPPQALRAFLEYAGTAPLLAFHAPFDRSFLQRAVRRSPGAVLGDRWLDVAQLASAVQPKLRLRSLDEWLEATRTPVLARHSAVADAFATALLVARLLPEARRQGAGGFRELQRLARQAKWLQ